MKFSLRLSLQRGKGTQQPRALRRFARTCVLGFAALGCSSDPALTDRAPHDINVQFTEMALEPSVAQVPPGASVVWISEATTYTGAVLFPATIKDAFTCADLRPTFALVAAGYLSQPISGDLENVKLPCPLKPGTYAYELLLYEPDFGGADDPVRTLKGSIVAQ